MQYRGTRNHVDADLKETRDLDRVKQRKQANAHGNADVAVSHLGGDHNVLSSHVAVVQRDEGIGQHHQCTAEPAQILDAYVGALDRGNPVHQIVDAAEDAVGASSDQQQVEHDGPVKAPVLAHIAFEDFKHMQHLPEQEQSHQHQAIVKINRAVLGERP